MRALLEREEDLAELDQALARACAAAGQVIVVEGPVGIGKTSPLTAARAEGRDHGTLAGRSSSSPGGSARRGRSAWRCGPPRWPSRVSAGSTCSPRRSRRWSAAEGRWSSLTNREIAQALFVWDARFSKLGVRSRKQLAQALAEIA